MAVRSKMNTCFCYRIYRLWKMALNDDGSAYRRLGILFYYGKYVPHDVVLARLCLKHAAMLGDLKGFVLYKKLFLKKRKVIDNISYREIAEDYISDCDKKRKKSFIIICVWGQPGRRKKLKSFFIRIDK